MQQKAEDHLTKRMFTIVFLYIDWILTVTGCASGNDITEFHIPTC